MPFQPRLGNIYLFFLFSKDQNCKIVWFISQYFLTSEPKMLTNRFISAVFTKRSIAVIFKVQLR